MKFNGYRMQLATAAQLLAPAGSLARMRRGGIRLPGQVVRVNVMQPPQRSKRQQNRWHQTG